MLQRELIAGNPFINERISGVFNYIENETLQANHEASDSIQDWYLYGFRTGKDFKYCREKIIIKATTITNNYQNGLTDLSEIEKSIVIEYMACPTDLIINELGTGLEYKENVNLWIQRSKKARVQRWEELKFQVFNTLTEAKALLAEAEKDGLLALYIEGVEGVGPDGGSGLFDFIDATIGSNYESNGLRTRSYTPITGQSMTQVCNLYMSIIQDGEYFLTEDQREKF